MNTEEREESPLTVVDVIREVFLRFPLFALRHLTHPKPPAMFVMVWLIGMDAMAGAIELERFQLGEYTMSNWFHAWLRIMFGGAFAGALRYWIVGSIFHLIVRAAGGTGPARTSRYIFLYAVVPVAVVDLSLKVIQMLVYGNGYFAGQTHPVFDFVGAVTMLATYLYSAALCYHGMRLLQRTDRLRSIVLLGTLGLVLVVAMFGLGTQGG